MLTHVWALLSTLGPACQCGHAATGTDARGLTACGPIAPASRPRPGQEVFCSVAVLVLWLRSHAAGGTPLAVGGRVTTCTPIPPPRRMTRDLMFVLGHTAVSQVREVVPSTSWVAFCACANASNAAETSSSVSRVSWW